MNKLIAVALLLLTVSCAKDDVLFETEKIPTLNFSSYEDPLRNAVASYLIYTPDFDHPYENISQEIRNEFVFQFETSRTRVESGATTSDAEIAGLLRSVNANPEFISQFLLIGNLFQNTIGSDLTSGSFQQANEVLFNELSLITANDNLADAEQEALGYYVSTLMGINDYYQSMWNISMGDAVYLQKASCSLEESFKCVINTTIEGVKLGAGIGLFVSFASPELATLTVLAGGVVGIITGVVRVIIGDRGPCCDKTFDCTLPLGITVQFSDCSLNAQVSVYGYGKDLTSLVWNNRNGSPTTYRFNLASGELPIRKSVTQLDPGVPVVSSFGGRCKNGRNISGRSFELDLNVLRKQVIGAYINGIKQVQDGIQYTYSIQQISSTRRYTVDKWEVVGGYVISSSNTTVTVLWQRGMQTGYVKANVRNTCYPDGGTGSIQTKIVNKSNFGPENT